MDRIADILNSICREAFPMPAMILPMERQESATGLTSVSISAMGPWPWPRRHIRLRSS